jgi:hypothetical protein
MCNTDLFSKCPACIARCACALRNILNVLCSVAKPLFAVTANDGGGGAERGKKVYRDEMGGGARLIWQEGSPFRYAAAAVSL